MRSDKEDELFDEYMSARADVKDILDDMTILDYGSLEFQRRYDLAMSRAQALFTMFQRFNG